MNTKNFLPNKLLDFWPKKYFFPKSMTFFEKIIGNINVYVTKSFLYSKFRQLNKKNNFSLRWQNFPWDWQIRNNKNFRDIIFFFNFLFYLKQFQTHFFGKFFFYKTSVLFFWTPNDRWNVELNRELLFIMPKNKHLFKKNSKSEVWAENSTRSNFPGYSKLLWWSDSEGQILRLKKAELGKTSVLV